MVRRMPLIEGLRKGYTNDLSTEIRGGTSEEFSIHLFRVSSRVGVNLEGFD